MQLQSTVSIVSLFAVFVLLTLAAHVAFAVAPPARRLIRRETGPARIDPRYTSSERWGSGVSSLKFPLDTENESFAQARASTTAPAVMGPRLRTAGGPLNVVTWRAGPPVPGAPTSRHIPVNVNPTV